MNRVSQHILDYQWEFFGLAVGLAFFGNTLRFLKRAIALENFRNQRPNLI